jgi:hypothetical protein
MVIYGLKVRVTLCVVTNVSEDSFASIFRFEVINTASFSTTFLKIDSEAYDITILSVCLSVFPPITFEPISTFLKKIQ